MNRIRFSLLFPLVLSLFSSVYAQSLEVDSERLDATNGRVTKEHVPQKVANPISNLLFAQSDLEKLRNQNINRKWVASARGVGSCGVTQVRAIERAADGASVFAIQFECRYPMSGGGVGRSSGVTNLYCGYNRSNQVSSNNVQAVCQ